MELRTLEYFLAIAREGSLTRAATTLHVTQPTLSRQLASLEKELGQQLYVRTHSGIQLTQAGEVLRGYAASIVELSEKAEDAVSLTEREISGPVYLGLGETAAVSVLARAMARVRAEHPGVTFRIRSGNAVDLMDGLVSGAFDFLLECDVRPHHDLNELDLPDADYWGVVVRDDDPLAARSSIRIADLAGRDLIVSGQEERTVRDNGAAGDSYSLVSQIARAGRVVATFTLAYNTRYLVREGLGIALVYDSLIEVGGDTGLTFIPIEDAPGEGGGASSGDSSAARRRVYAHHGLLWRKVLLTKQAQVFLDAVRAECEAARSPLH